jgi:hypothetical protein
MNLHAICNVMEHFIFYVQESQNSSNLPHLNKLFNQVLPMILEKDALQMQMANFIITLAADRKNSDLSRIFLAYLISKKFFREDPKFASLNEREFYLNLLKKTLLLTKRSENVTFHSDLKQIISKFMAVLNTYPFLEVLLVNNQQQN